MENDRAVRKKKEHVSELRRRRDESKNSSLKAKKAYDEAVDELSNLIAEANDPQQKLPFDGDEAEADRGERRRADPSGNDPPQAAAAESRQDASEPRPEASKPRPEASKPRPEASKPRPEASKPQAPPIPPATSLWREIPVNEMDIPKPSIAALRAAGVETLGDYEAFQKGDWPEFPEGAASIKGWGAKKVNQADAAFAKLRGVHAPQSPSDELPARVEILQASNAMIAKGLTVGTIAEAKLVGAHAHVKNRDGEHVTLLKGEFAIVGGRASEQPSGDPGKFADEAAEPEIGDEQRDRSTYEPGRLTDEEFDQGPPAAASEHRVRTADATG